MLMCGQSIAIDSWVTDVGKFTSFTNSRSSSVCKGWQQRGLQLWFSSMTWSKYRHTEIKEQFQNILVCQTPLPTLQTQQKIHQNVCSVVTTGTIILEYTVKRARSITFVSSRVHVKSDECLSVSWQFGSLSKTKSKIQICLKAPTDCVILGSCGREIMIVGEM